MSINKIDIITSTLEQQIEKFNGIATLARKEMYEHSGASEALGLLAKQMPGFAAAIEERVERDDNLSGDTAIQVLTYSKNIIARFLAMCESNSKAQHQQKFVAQGRMETALSMIDALRKDITKEKAFAKRREEIAEENRKANAAVDEVTQEVNSLMGTDKDEPVAKKGNGVPGKKADAKKATRKKAASKKPRKRRTTKKAPQPQAKLPLDSDDKTEETDSKPDGDNAG